ncbi:MAG TPA: T9SS type A sorting domain-containing protein, partial [Prolixibacteraceae bacterium]|nr:T9SS type A sorting domain-containing protein [Prolixibacteraceae bacterium]
ILTGIDPVSGCSPQSIESVTATSDNLTLVPSVQVEYVKGEATAKLKINIADNQVGDTRITVKIKDNGGVENGGVDIKEISFNVKVEFPTGIEDINSRIGAKIYPNPSYGPVTVECVGFVEPSIRIFKVTGEEVFKKSQMTGLTQSLDLTSFGPGVYLVEISEDKKVITKKLIIKN